MAKLLIVDDEVDILASYEIILRLEGFEVDTAPHGAAALAKIAEAKPDLVITDWMMPVMDGVELICRLKDKPCTRALPVLLLSAAGDPGRLHGVPVDQFLRKPVLIPDLLAAIARWLPKRRETTD